MIGWCCNIKHAYQGTELPESHGVLWFSRDVNKEGYLSGVALGQQSPEEGVGVAGVGL